MLFFITIEFYLKFSYAVMERKREMKSKLFTIIIGGLLLTGCSSIPVFNDENSATSTDESTTVSNDTNAAESSTESSTVSKTSTDLEIPKESAADKVESGETANETAALTAGQKNAVRKAKRYLDYTSFSREGLIGQLEYEGFSNEEAAYAVDQLSIDWTDQAKKKAGEYLEYDSFSREGLIDQLEFEKFTPDQATQAVDSVNADWNEQAVRKAESYLEYSSFSLDSLIDQLEFEGFTPEQAAHGAQTVYQ